MNQYERGISYPRRRDDWMRDHPLASRLLIMIVGFAVLVPIGLIIRASQGNVVRSGGLPGAAMAADPLIVASTTSSVVATMPTVAPPAPPPTEAAAAPSTASVAVAAAETEQTSTTAKKKATTTSEAPATTAAPKQAATTAAPKPTNPPTTKAPTTTAAPTTTTTTESAPPANTYSKADVEAIIRSVFPADQADEAVRIATRESNLVPTARNWCCYGLFQIYFKTNKKTLASIGVTSPEQLYDPTVNAQAAYLLFQRSGWSPWR